MNQRALVLSVALCLVSSSTFAQAPPPAAPVGPASPAGPAAPAGEADAHFKRGVDLYKEADYATALIEFRRAYEIDPRYQALYNIGETYDQLQDYASALKTFEKYLHDGGAQISAGRRDDVQKEIDKLRTRVARIEVTTNVPDVEIAVDDVSVGRTPLSAPLLVSAGRRKVTATRAGKPPVTQVVELAGGDSKKIALSVDAGEAAGPDAGPVAPPPSAGVPAAPWVITGVLVAGAAVTGGLALSSSSDLKAKLAVFPGASPGDISSAQSKTFALAVTTDVLIGCAIVAGGISIYFTATAGSRGDRKTGPAAPHVAWASWASPFTTAATAPASGPFVRLGAGPRGAQLVGTF